MNDDNPHRICELEKEIVRLNQEMRDNNKAVVLAEKVASAHWMAAISLVGTAVALLGVMAIIAIALLKH